ncbi:MAG TPA: hypothetical protein VHN99_11760 [Deinococcales bacterium]|nr:hypothetical protein [Deinococcales bacterium]
MYPFEAWFVRASFLYLLYTGVTGTLFYVFPGLIHPMVSAHAHSGTVGFFLNMVMGVAYWMMPRPNQLRQDRAEAWTFALLNAGLLARLILEPPFIAWHWPVRALLAASGALQVAGIAVFALAMTQRVLTSADLRRLRAERDARAGRPQP